MIVVRPPERCIILNTTHSLILVLGLGAALDWSRLPGFGQQPKPAPAGNQLVIPFDFESKFDNGVYGQVLGDMIWKKLQRRGCFVIPDSMLETREWCQRNKFLPGPETPLDKMKTVVCKEQAGDIAIWGKIERVAGNEFDVYDLWIFIADFSAEPARMIFQKKARTQTVSEIPHLYVKNALDALYGGSEQTVKTILDPATVKERWEKGPNLLKGDFETGKTFPLGWDPLPRHVSWISDKTSGKKNRFIRFSIPADVAETTGVLYYSEFFPVQAGATYRFQCRWHSSGTAVKVFIKCYDEVQGPFRSKNGPSGGTERREVYRSQQNLNGPSGQWNLHTEDFTPRHTQYNPRWGRVMLYAYYPSGTVDWDDVVLKQISPPRPRTGPSRPSLETKAPSKEIK